jgi:hypothetical protein
MVSTFSLLSQSTLYIRSCADASTRYIPRILMGLYYTRVFRHSNTVQDSARKLDSWVPMGGPCWSDGPTLFLDGIWRLFKPGNPTDTEKCCFVSPNGNGSLSSLLAMLLIQIRVQGGGEAKLPSFLTYRLILIILAMNRENKTVYTEAQPSQLKSQKYRPIPSQLILLCVAQVFDIRTSGNEPSGNT